MSFKYDNCLLVLMLYVPVNMFQSCRVNFLSSWVEPVLSTCSRTQHSDSAGGGTCNPLIPSLRLYQLSHCALLKYDDVTYDVNTIWKIMLTIIWMIVHGLFFRPRWCHSNAVPCQRRTELSELSDSVPSFNRTRIWMALCPSLSWMKSVLQKIALECRWRYCNFGNFRECFIFMKLHLCEVSW